MKNNISNTKLFRTAYSLYKLQELRAHKTFVRFAKLSRKERDFWLGRAVVFLTLPKKERLNVHKALVLGTEGGVRHA